MESRLWFILYIGTQLVESMVHLVHTHMASGDRVNLENVELLRLCHFVSYAL